ncbi:hypothetical protein M0R45_015801 [Rubus argutus]|uniref:MHC class I antigen n=1 Tax=Rubus argutus TaxID=59490 RepID=A0AAW1XUD4_RUBAR
MVTPASRLLRGSDAVEIRSWWSGFFRRPEQWELWTGQMAPWARRGREHALAVRRFGDELEKVRQRRVD